MIQFSITKKFLNLINKKEKVTLISIFFIQFISAFLEILSVGSLLPIFKAVTDPKWNEKYFGFIGEEYRVITIFTSVIILFILKDLFLIGGAYLTGKFKNRITLRMVKDTYDSYLNQKYEFHINNHSSTLLRNMEYMDTVSSIFMRLIAFYSDLILAIMAFMVVMVIDVRITFFALFLIIVILLAYGMFTRLSIEKYGSSSQNYNTSYMKNMMEGIRSFKEILLSGKQSFFSERNKNYKDQALRYNLKFTVIEIIPKYLLELIFVFSILAVTYYFVFFEKIDLYQHLAFIGVVVLGLFKFLPNLLRIFSSYQQFKYLLPVIDIISENLQRIKQDKANEIDLDKDPIVQTNFEKNIEFRDVSFGYSDKNILNNINIVIKKNSFIGIQGESGSGKTTILNILTGLISPTEGSIFVDGNLQNLSTRTWQKKIGFVSQNTHLLDDTIKTNIAFGSDISKIDEKLMQDCIKKSGLEEFISSLKLGLDTIVGENGTKISGGQIQRIGIARAFYKKPEILILDEPTNSLDKENEKKIVETLKNSRNNVTIIIVSHNEIPLQIADKKFYISNGKITS